MYILKSQRGQSLIQIMISIGIMGIMMIAMTSMHNVQSRENTSLMEKVITVETMRLLSQSASDPIACKAIFDAGNIISPSPATFDAGTISAATPFVITVRTIPGLANNPPVATAGQPIGTVAPTVTIPANGIQVKVTSANSADLVLGFDQSRLVRPVHNLQVRLNLQTTGPANAKQIVGCYGGTNGPLQQFTATDFAALPGNVVMNQPNYYAVVYSVNLPVKSYAQRLMLTTSGIWDIAACLGSCNAAVRVTTIINGVQSYCGSNSSYGSSSAYDGMPDITVTCSKDVPADATVQVQMLFDGRGGQRAHFATSYSAGGASGTTPVLSVLSIPNG